MSGEIRKEPKRLKQKKKKKEESEDEFEHEETETVKSEDEEEKEDRNLSADSQLESIFDHLNERRGATRVSGLNSLTVLLRTHFLRNLLSDKEDTLAMYLTNSIKKGEAPEISAACEALSLLIVTLGPDAIRLYRSVFPVLVTLIKDASKSPDIRSAAIQSLSMACFIVGSSEEDNQECLNVFGEVFKTGDDELVAEALSGWGLIASTYPSVVLASNTLPKTLPTFSELLEHKSLEVRTACGQNIALLWSAYQEVEESSEDEEESGASDDESRVIQLKTKRKHSFDDEAEDVKKRTGVDITELIEKLEELATDSSKSRAKKEKVKQRSIFRDILSTFEEGIVPTEQLKLGKYVHEFSSWPQLLQLDAFRSVLGKGFQLHFLHNDLIAEIFDLDFTQAEEESEDEEHLTKQQKREAARLRAKDTYEDRNKQRKKKFNFLARDE